MECLVENTTEVTQELLKEFFSKTIVLWYRAIVLVFGVFSFYFAAIQLTTDNSFSLSTIVFAAFFIVAGAFFFLWNFLLAARIMSKRHFRQLRVIFNNAPIVKTACFYEDRLEVLSSNGAKTVLFYQNTKKQYLSKNLYIIIFQGKVAAFIRKDSFTKGSLEEARTLIQKAKS